MSDTKLMAPLVEVGTHTDPGRDPEKQVNEDACRYAETPFGQLAVLCDGMGGHEGGREASNAAIDAIFRYVAVAPERPDIPPATRAREVLRDAIAVANQDVYGLTTAKGVSRPGSTVVAVLVHPLGTDVAHVGDSRCYLVHDGHIRQVTRDHSMVQQLVDAGVLTADQAASHPDANMITRALGMGGKVEVELQRHAVAHEKGDTFILCSDGLSDLVADGEMPAIVGAGSCAEAAAKLVDLANARGGHDNITVMLVRTHEAARASSAAVPESVVLARTETMPVVAAPPSGNLPPSVPSNRALPMSGAAVLPPAPLPHVPRRRSSPVVAIGLFLALVGVVAVVAVLWLLASPHQDRNEVPGLALSVVLPASSLSPAGDSVDAADLDARSPEAGPRVRHYKRRPHR